MNEHIKNCAHCGQPMTALKATKKYCCESCKQAAFYVRNAIAITLNSNDQREPEGGVNDKNSHCSQPLNATGSARLIYRPTVSRNAISSYTVTFGNRTKDENYSYYEEGEDVNTLDKEAKQLLTLQKAELPLNATTEETGFPPDKPLNEKNEAVAGTVKETHEHPAVKQYLPVRPKLINQIEWYLEDHATATTLYQHPNEHWSSYDLEKVKWVSVRLRCLIENLLYFDGGAIEYEPLSLINNSLLAMMKSNNYVYLPRNYPPPKKK